MRYTAEQLAILCVMQKQGASFFSSENPYGAPVVGGLAGAAVGGLGTLGVSKLMGKDWGESVRNALLGGAAGGAIGAGAGLISTLGDPPKKDTQLLPPEPPEAVEEEYTSWTSAVRRFLHSEAIKAKGNSKPFGEGGSKFTIVATRLPTELRDAPFTEDLKSWIPFFESGSEPSLKDARILIYGYDWSKEDGGMAFDLDPYLKPEPSPDGLEQVRAFNEELKAGTDSKVYDAAMEMYRTGQGITSSGEKLWIGLQDTLDSVDPGSSTNQLKAYIAAGLFGAGAVEGSYRGGKKLWNTPQGALLRNATIDRIGDALSESYYDGTKAGYRRVVSDLAKEPMAAALSSNLSTKDVADLSEAQVKLEQYRKNINPKSNKPALDPLGNAKLAIAHLSKRESALTSSLNVLKKAPYNPDSISRIVSVSAELSRVRKQNQALTEIYTSLQNDYRANRKIGLPELNPRISRLFDDVFEDMAADGLSLRARMAYFAQSNNEAATNAYTDLAITLKNRIASQMRAQRNWKSGVFSPTRGIRVEVTADDLSSIPFFARQAELAVGNAANADAVYTSPKSPALKALVNRSLADTARDITARINTVPTKAQNAARRENIRRSTQADISTRNQRYGGAVGAPDGASAPATTADKTKKKRGHKVAGFAGRSLIGALLGILFVNQVVGDRVGDVNRVETGSIGKLLGD